MTKYIVTGVVSDVGRIAHVIKAANKAEAWERFERAYSRRTCVHVETLVMLKNPYREAA